MFSGRWVTTEPVTVGPFNGYPELGIGHFGPELVGVIRFWDIAGTPVDTCSCTIMEARSVRTGTGTFTAAAPLCDAGAWFISLAIDTEPDLPRLVGTITHNPVGGGAPEVVNVAFEQADTSVDEEFRQCTP